MSDPLASLRAYGPFDSPTQAREWAESVQMAPRVRRKVDQLITQWQRKIDGEIVERVNASVEFIGETATEQQAEILDARRVIASVRQRTAAGRMTADQALRALTTQRRRIDQANKVIESLHRSGERANAVADLDTDEYLEQKRNRMPSVSYLYQLSIPEGYLAGDEPSPLEGLR